MREMKHSIIIAVAALSLILSFPLSRPANVVLKTQVQPPLKLAAKAIIVPKATVAPTPVPTVIPTPRVVLSSYKCQAYAGLINQYPWNRNVASAICEAESGGNPGSISPLNTDGLRDYGLFQIHGEEILDPAANVARAYRKYLDQGWGAWSSYNSGKYLQYL